MRSVLLGNGINIQFGGFAYNSDFIMKRIKYSARLDRYEKLFENKITGDEIEKLLNSFVTIANDIIAKSMMILLKISIQLMQSKIFKADTLKKLVSLMKLC